MGIDPYLSDLMRLRGFSIQSMETAMWFARVC